MAHKYTEAQGAFILAHAKGRSSQELTTMFNKEFALDLKTTQIHSYKGNRRICSGCDTKFRKGHMPINKGIKGMFNVGGNKTSFKVGHKPKNYKPVGFERTDRDGYVLVKVQDDGPWHKRWRAKHRVLWEKEHGPIPEGYRLIFLDGNRSNVTLSNLKLVSYGVSASMCSIGLYSSDPKLTELGSNVAETIMKVNTLGKEETT